MNWIGPHSLVIIWINESMRFTFHLFILDIYFIHLSINEKKGQAFNWNRQRQQQKMFSFTIYLSIGSIIFFTLENESETHTHTHIIEQTNVPETMKNVIVRFFSFLSISNVFFFSLHWFIFRQTNQPTNNDVDDKIAKYHIDSHFQRFSLTKMKNIQ